MHQRRPRVAAVEYASSSSSPSYHHRHYFGADKTNTECCTPQKQADATIRRFGAQLAAADGGLLVVSPFSRRRRRRLLSFFSSSSWSLPVVVWRMLWTFASSGRTVLLLLLFIWLVVPWLSFSTLESILANQSAGLPLGFLFLSGDEIPITSPTIAFLETLVRYSRTFPSTIDLDDNNNWIPLLDQKSHRLNSFSYFRSLDLPPSESVLPFDESDALPDFDGLERQRRIRSEPGWNVAHINTGDDELLHIYRASLLEQQDDEDEDGYNERYDDIDMNYDCIRPGWTYRSYPVCNAFHEITLERTTGSSSSTDTTGTATERGRPTTGHRRDSSTSSIEYLGAGYFRDSWLLDWNQKIKISGTTIRDNNKAVLKHLRYEREQNADSWTKVHTEAVIMEATTSSLVTTNIYGHCATSLLVEAANEITNDIVPYIPSLQPSRGRISNEKLLELEKIRGGQPYPMNNFTTLEKLNIAIQMAAGLAEMHGMMGGVVVNNDAHPDQWLITNDNSVILNDMNNAAFLEWNFDEEDYCYYESWFDGDFRAPEQYVVNGTEVNESVDIWPMGNLIFTLLTGLWPYYNITREKVIQTITMAGERPHLHPAFRHRSFIERRLTEIMDQCHVLEPMDRVDIFTVLNHLRETKRMYHMQHQM